MQQKQNNLHNTQFNYLFFSGVEAAHASVEEIISEIQNPDLDSSLEDIQVTNSRFLTFLID